MFIIRMGLVVLCCTLLFFGQAVLSVILQGFLFMLGLGLLSVLVVKLVSIYLLYCLL